MNDSSTGGYLAPLPFAPPLEDQALDRFLQQVVVGVTGIDGRLVRPRWQVEPANLPDVGTDWAAFGVSLADSDWNASVEHKDDGDELQRHEVLDVLVSFYGPNASSMAALLRDGLQVPQNLEALASESFGLVETGKAVTVPELVKDKWLRRVDQPVVLKREVMRTYGVLNVLTAGTHTTAEGSKEFEFNTES